MIDAPSICTVCEVFAPENSIATHLQLRFQLQTRRVQQTNSSHQLRELLLHEVDKYFRSRWQVSSESVQDMKRHGSQCQLRQDGTQTSRIEIFLNRRFQNLCDTQSIQRRHSHCVTAVGVECTFQRHADTVRKRDGHHASSKSVTNMAMHTEIRCRFRRAIAAEIFSRGHEH